jgi:alkanesulfonate monooxygenase SsuD/methylene tetrahydromethanopterin reductase-like flavin-dependent oxidoreductase (luciferase family)
VTATTAQTVDASTLDSPLFRSPNRLKLAAFHMNCTRGCTPTHAEGSIEKLDWAQQVRIAQAAERAGIEAIIPIARWRGYPGTSNFNFEQFEVFPWAAGLAALTEKIVVFATAHVPLIHPVRAAKEVVTVDHISNGRFGLNVVAGWNAGELSMFGLTQREHDERYQVATEWADFVKRLWTSDEEFDFHGTYFQAERAISEPKPIQRPRPPLMSAGSSPAGCAFAAAHADVCFALAQDLDGLKTVAADIKNRAAALGREVAVWTSAGLVCGDTEADAKRQYDYFIHEKGDWDCAAQQVEMALGGDLQSITFDMSKAMQERILAFQSANTIIGTPEHIVSQLDGLASAGIDGVAAMWLDYESGIETFREEILPIAIDAGLRVPT